MPRNNNLPKVIYSKEQVEQIINEANLNVFVVYILADIQETLIINAEALIQKTGNYRFEAKKDILAMKKISEKFRTDVFRHVSAQCNEMFADICDQITEDINKVVEENILKL